MTETPANRPGLEDLLELLACPKCKGSVRLEARAAFVCERCRLLYPIEDGIPNFLVEEARPWSG